jgi:hypothetical protein
MMDISQFIIGLLIGFIMGGWTIWSYCVKEWEKIFKEILPQLTGYKNLKDRMK